MAEAESSTFGTNPMAGLSAIRSNVVLSGVGGDHDQRRGLPVGRQLPGDVETRLLAQADIDQHDVRPQHTDAFDCVRAGTGHSGHGNPVRLQQGLRRFEERRVVIHHHAPQHHQVSLPACGPLHIAASRSDVSGPGPAPVLGGQTRRGDR